MNNIETIPKDGTVVLVLARGWSWDSRGDRPDIGPSWRVAAWTDYMCYDEDDEPEIISITSNPYSDYAFEPLGWVELPEVKVEL